MIDTSRVEIVRDQVLAELQRHVGRENGIHMRDLVARITNSMINGEALERKVRELIAELRTLGHGICAHPASGYYIAANAKELDDTCRFLLERSQSTVNQVGAMKSTFPPDLYEALGVRKSSRSAA